MFIWQEIQSTYEQQQLAVNMAEFLKKYIDMAASLDGLSPKGPLYKVTEGNERCFFTTFFSWDAAKAIVSMLQNLLFWCVMFVGF